jgi:beta-1,4-mannosyltransferase
VRVLLVDRSMVNGYCLGLAGGLRREGVDVWVGGPAGGGGRTVAVYPRSAPGRHAAKALEGVAGMARYRVALRKRPDLVHFQWPTRLDERYARMAKRVLRAPIAYTAHNVGRAGDDGRSEAAQARFVAMADLVFTHGPSQRGALLATHPEAAPKVHAIEHGNYEHAITRYPRSAARAALGTPATGPLYVFVGQVRPRKRVELLLEAFADHVARGGSGHLLVAGTASAPEYAERLEGLAGRCRERIAWRVSPQPQPQEVLDLALSAATQVVLPFADASQSGSLVLAMTHGRCAVSTSVGEVSRTLAGRGLLVSPDDEPGLSRALAVAAERPEHCDELGERARQYALTKLAWPTIAAEVAALYRDVVESGTEDLQ